MIVWSFVFFLILSVSLTACFFWTGKGKGHKGGRRQFTNPDELNRIREKEEKEKAWRRKKGEIEESSDEDEEDSEESQENTSNDDNEENDEEEEEETVPKSKGVEAIIKINNPNRVTKKVNKREINSLQNAEVTLSRREREEIQKQQSRANYQRLTAEGKTEQARADLARLAIVRQQREEAAKRKEEEKKAKEYAKAKSAEEKTASTKSFASEITSPSSSTALGKGKLRKK